jgi:hypothetical protein
MTSLIREVLASAIAQTREKRIPVYTFALYLDHESGAVSVCVDTEENSARMLKSMNDYNVEHFMREILDGDLKAAALWQANIGRSLSLGDFVAVNLARTSLGSIEVDEQLELAMVRALINVQDQVAALSPAPERLILACSSCDDEVGHVWSLPSSA